MQTDQSNLTKIKEQKETKITLVSQERTELEKSLRREEAPLGKKQKEQRKATQLQTRNRLS
jgi:hypothetical protein